MPAMVFDLRSERQRLIELDRGLYAAMFVLPAVFLTIVIGLWLSTFPQAERVGLLSPAGASFLGVEVACAGGTLYCLAAALTKRPGAVSARVGSDGVVLQYGPNSFERFLSEVGGGTLVAYDFSLRPNSIRTGNRYYMRANHFWSRLSLLSPDAFQGIVSTARQCDAEIRTEQSGKWSTFGPNVTVYHIRAVRREIGPSHR